VDLEASFFLRKQSDTIDWVKNTSTSAWLAQNVGKVDVYGVDASAKIDFDCFLSSWDIYYTYLELEQKNLYNFSKYIFDYNRHKVVNRFGFDINDFKVNFITNFAKPAQRDEYVTCDLKIEKRLKHWIFAIEGINIFNEDYDEMQDISGVGRWYKVSMSLEF
jgi:outer membrane receptor protein involved in Fe transport